jgi:hypothetical protein
MALKGSGTVECSSGMSGKKAKPVDEAPSSSGPKVVVDAETGEQLTLNVSVFGAPRDKGASAAAASVNLVLSGRPGGERARALPVTSAKELKLAHEAELLDFVSLEAEREGMRRDLLYSELKEWKREVMKKTFFEERQAAATGLRALKIGQEKELARFLKASLR